MSVVLTCLHISHKNTLSDLKQLNTLNFWTNIPEDAKSLTGCLAKQYFPSYSHCLIYSHTTPVHVARHFPWENFFVRYAMSTSPPPLSTLWNEAGDIPSFLTVHHLF